LPTVVSVSALKASEVAYVDRCLPLNRLCQQTEAGSTYLVAWDGDQPVGHAHIAWAGTHLGVPEIARGWYSISLSVSQEGNAAATRLYAKLDYSDAGVAPVHVSGTTMLRGRAVEVDDTLVYVTKSL
jgi:hypothetical protein